MFDELFAPLYAPVPDVGKYLERIGLAATQCTDSETLDALVIAHQRSVPFENLDVFDAGLDISIDIPTLYDKIVTRRRGGYCFELNAAFMGLLKGIGYECHAVAARVLRTLAYCMPLSHRATIVTIGGARYFCDVGFGGPSPQRALLLDETAPQSDGKKDFVFEKSDKGTVMYRLVGESKEPILMFSETPFDPVDFLALNEYQSKNKNSYFKSARMINLVTEAGSTTLTGNVLSINTNSGSTEQTLHTESSLRQAMSTHFGIKVDYPLRVNG